ncbi:MULTISPECIES: FadR/GntR family transcriptional regulator [unclassified Meridianimarinicoccus]|uniref:FadR/GntR family transcriptional regulator n=1 Tax=unclassified Meridianimarinicoccus TaxID=2923344 RepID=UPI00186969AE|nr:FadR/GntR family transcriptional regulator [Fluviibacterium sp. MJW13]
MDGGSDSTERRSDQIYRQLAEGIAAGRLARGEKLPSETALATEYGVSRPTVREALARLREEGMIASRRGSGAYVQDAAERITRIAPLTSIQDLQMCFRFRIGLESEAARLAAQNRTRDDLRGLEAEIAAMDSANVRGETGMEQDLGFHMAVARASQNRFFVAGLEQVRPHIAQGMTINRTLSLMSEAPRLVRVQDEHRRVCDAIRKGDGDAAAEAMATHLGNALNRLFEG